MVKLRLVGVIAFFVGTIVIGASGYQFVTAPRESGLTADRVLHQFAPTDRELTTTFSLSKDIRFPTSGWLPNVPTLHRRPPPRSDRRYSTQLPLPHDHGLQSHAAKNETTHPKGPNDDNTLGSILPTMTDASNENARTTDLTLIRPPS